MDELYKKSEKEANNQLSKLSTLSELNDQNRQKPNLLRINADNQDKKFMCIFWSIFLIFVIVLAISSKTLPKAIKPVTNDIELKGTNLEGCQNPNLFEKEVLKCGSFEQKSALVGIVAKQLSSLNQFITFWLQIYPKELMRPLIIDQNITYLLYGLQPAQNGFKKGEIYENESVKFQYTSESTNYIYGDDGKTIKGYKVFLGFIGQFPANNLLLTLQFSGPIQQFANVNTIKMSAYKIGKSFTVFTIVLRYVFFVLSILAGFLYNRKYRKIAITDRIIEQKLIEILSVFLIFFNDPFYPITVLKQNMVSSFFSMLFVLSFIVYVIFMWVIFFDRILYEEGQKETQQITKFKIAYAVLLFSLLMALYMLYANYRLNNHPLVPTEKLGERSILVLDTLASVCFGAVILYIVFQYIRICCDKSDRLWRSELIMSYSILFIAAMIVFIFTDNALGSYHYDGTTFIFLYGLMNLYTWYLQFMYSPTKETTDQLNEKKSLNSNQLMSVATVEFNDLNINLDDHDENLSFGTWKPNIHTKQDNLQKEQKDFTIEDDDQDFYPQPNQIGPIQVNEKKEIQEIDFFNGQKVKANISNFQEPFSHKKKILNQNHQQYPDAISYQDQSQELDQNKLQILSDIVNQQPQQNSQQKPINDPRKKPSIENDKKKEGFGNFELD